jgi:putative ABC transport system substrate-binding protein
VLERADQERRVAAVLSASPLPALAVPATWVELLKEISPATARMAVHSSLNYPFVEQFIQSAEAAAARLSVSLTVSNVQDLPELERDIAAFGVQPNGGLVVMADTLAVVNYQRIIQLAHQHHLPAIYPWPFCPRHGGLSSYSYDMISMARAGAGYIDRILRGAKPSELPVQQSTKFNLILNLKTAQALGLTIAQSLLARADEVIE